MTPRPQRIAKFEVLQSLGEGAMGAVFLARDTTLGREVALKAMHPAAVPTAEVRDRFLREAQAACRLDHPHLVTTHEAGEHNGVVYLAMEYVGGESLAQVILDRSLRPLELLELLAQVCDGLAYAHARGVFHRDLKPANIRVTRVSGRPTAKILDFGISRLAGSDLSGTGAINGTFAYMAPEHTRSAKPDAKGDIFAVGVILYEALTGVRPFDGDNAAASLNRLIHDEPAPLTEAQMETISPAIQGVLQQALAKDPARRLASAAALAASLRAARNPAWSPQADAERMERTARTLLVPGLTRQPEPEEPQPGSGRWLRILAALVGLAALAGLAVGGAYAWRQRQRAQVPVVIQPAPQPVPAPIPEPVAPPAPEPEVPAAPVSQSRFKNLEEAEAAVGKDPKEALIFLEETLAADAENETALALRMVALYNLGRYGACAKAMGEAKAAGHPLLKLATQVKPLRKMLEAEKADPRLPRKPKPAAAPAAPAA